METIRGGWEKLGREPLEGGTASGAQQTSI